MDTTDRDAMLLKSLIKFCLRLFVYLAAAWLAMALAVELGLGAMLGLAILFIGWLVYFSTAVFYRLDKIEQRLAEREQNAADQRRVLRAGAAYVIIMVRICRNRVIDDDYGN